LSTGKNVAVAVMACETFLNLRTRKNQVCRRVHFTGDTLGSLTIISQAGRSRQLGDSLAIGRSS
jgi:hypothetical protein